MRTYNNLWQFYPILLHDSFGLELILFIFLLPIIILRDRVQFMGQEDPLEEGMATTPVLFPGEFNGQRSIVGYSQWCCKEQEMTE